MQKRRHIMNTPKLDKITEKFDNNVLIYIISRHGMGIRTFADTLTDSIMKTKESCHIYFFDYDNAEKFKNRFETLKRSKKYAIMYNEPKIFALTIPYKNKPTLADLRNIGIGIVEQDADVIMFLHRYDYTADNQDNYYPDITEFIIAKNRYGDTGTIKLKYNSKLKTFTEE